MTFRISRLRIVAAEDAGFSDLVSALPDGAETCLYCGRRSRDSLAMVLAADESDDNPLTLFTVICSKCARWRRGMCGNGLRGWSPAR